MNNLKYKLVRDIKMGQERMEEPIQDMLKEVRAVEGAWLQTHEPAWKRNPFKIKELVDRRLFTGYRDEMKQFLSYLDHGDSTLVTGIVGIGKTSFLKFVLEGLPQEEFQHVYITRPPPGIKDYFEYVLNALGASPEKSESTLKLFRKVVDSLVESADKGLKIVLVIDELGDARTEALHWIRTLHDASQFTLITSGPPETIDMIESKHFPLADRIAKTVSLNGLSKNEVFEFINRRVRYACSQSDFNGGKSGVCSNSEAGNCSACTSPFTRDAIDELYASSGGVPRELLKLCDDLLQVAMLKNLHTIDIENIIDSLKSRTKTVYETLTETQKSIVKLLFEKGRASSKVIADAIKSPVGSVLNQLNELLEKGVIQRSGTPRVYEYRLSPEMERYLQKGI